MSERAAGNEYDEHWRRYRRLRKRYFWIIFAFFPGTFLFAILGYRIFGDPVPGHVFGVTWMVVILVVGTRISGWRCPRCGKWFSATWWYNAGAFALACVHCGLPKFASNRDGSGYSGE